MVVFVDIKKLQDQLVHHEGLKLMMYKDTAGFYTIGVGHNLSAKGLKLDRVMDILKDDILDTINFLNNHLPWWQALDEVKARALADLTFDLMDKVLDFKHMLAALQAKDWSTASNELLNSAFARETGQRAIDLASMFRTGQDL